MTALRLQRGSDTQTEIPKDVHPYWDVSVSADSCFLPRAVTSSELGLDFVPLAALGGGVAPVGCAQGQAHSRLPVLVFNLG